MSKPGALWSETLIVDSQISFENMEHQLNHHTHLHACAGPEVLKYRFGQLWNMKIAYRQNRPYVPGLTPAAMHARCPHCGMKDPDGSYSGLCQSAVLKAMYVLKQTLRHDEAMRKVLKAITRGPHGPFLKIADIGRDELVQGLGIVSKRIPAWLLSDADLQAAGVSPARRNILRPDIMLVESSHCEEVAYASSATIQELSSQIDHHVPKALQPRLTKGSRRPPEADRPLPRPRIIWLLEGGNTSDTRYKEKFNEKQVQHRTLIEALGTYRI